MIARIDSGSLGTVVVVWHQQSHTYYAMKIMTKETILKFNHAEHILNERRVLGAINSPFLTKMDYCFQDNANLYLVMEYVCGKSLFHLSTRLNEAQAKFYAAQIALALHYLHSMNLVHGDLKVGNVLVDEHGYIRLADFGYSQRVDGRLNEVCGSRPYRAPEMIQHQGYGKEIDWWAFGVTIYQLITWESPFHITHQHLMSEEDIHWKILTRAVHYPSDFSPELRNLLENLFEHDPQQRYGINEVMRHKWFQGINWEDIYHKQIPAPMQPDCPQLDNTQTYEYSEHMIGHIPHVDPHADLFKNF